MKIIIIIACITFITLCAITNPKKEIVYEEKIRYVKVSCLQNEGCVKYIPKAGADLSSNQYTGHTINTGGAGD